jgi:hypothetical protein
MRVYRNDGKVGLEIPVDLPVCNMLREFSYSGSKSSGTLLGSTEKISIFSETDHESCKGDTGKAA